MKGSRAFDPRKRNILNQLHIDMLLKDPSQAKEIRGEKTIRNIGNTANKNIKLGIRRKKTVSLLNTALSTLNPRRQNSALHRRSKNVPNGILLPGKEHPSHNLGGCWDPFEEHLHLRSCSKFYAENCPTWGLECQELLSMGEVKAGSFASRSAVIGYE